MTLHQPTLRPAYPAPLPRKLVSLLVPVFNEQEAVSAFFTEIDRVFAPLQTAYDYEVIFVNDGSRDATEFVIRSRMTDATHIRLINLSRNFGKEAALSAAIDHARGDVCIPQDVDLQDQPEVIPEMLDLWSKGAQIVNALRANRTQDTWIKRKTAQGFYRVFNALADHSLPQDVGDFRLLDRRVVDVLRDMNERVRFNKALSSWVGFEADDVTFDRPERQARTSAWSY